MNGFKDIMGNRALATREQNALFLNMSQMSVRIDVQLCVSRR